MLGAHAGGSICRLMNKLSVYEFKRRALSVFFPNICPFCGRVIDARDYYCESCRELLPLINGELPPPENVSRLYACCWYSGIARAAVHMLKFKCLIYPADMFGLMMSRVLKDVKADALVPVPSGFLIIEKRGFSPAAVIAERVSMRLGIPILNALTADFDKTEQKTLTRKSRILNARKCFHISKNVSVRGKRLLIIDDVTTTGSTLSALAEILLNAGAADVSAAVFAQVPGSIKRPEEPKRYKPKRK